MRISWSYFAYAVRMRMSTQRETTTSCAASTPPASPACKRAPGRPFPAARRRSTSHHAAHVGDALPLEHVQHGLARRALGLPVVGVAHWAVLDQVAPAVVPGVIVPLLHLLNAGPGLLLALALRLILPHGKVVVGKVAHDQRVRRSVRKLGEQLLASLAQNAFAKVLYKQGRSGLHRCGFAFSGIFCFTRTWCL